MKNKITLREVKAHYTSDPERIAALIKEMEKIVLPEAIQNTAIDIADTLEANRISLDVIAAYLVRFALLSINENTENV